MSCWLFCFMSFGFIVIFICCRFCIYFLFLLYCYVIAELYVCCCCWRCCVVFFVFDCCLWGLLSFVVVFAWFSKTLQPNITYVMFLLCWDMLCNGFGCFGCQTMMYVRLNAFLLSGVIQLTSRPGRGDELVGSVVFLFLCLHVFKTFLPNLTKQFIRNDLGFV